MRLFVAVELSEDAKQAIVAAQKRLGRTIDTGPGLRWSRPDQMHVTLAFIGEVDASRASSIVDAGAPPIAMRPFDVAFAGLGVFPPRGAPRVLWLGASAGAEHLVRLQRIVADRLLSAAVELDDRPFHPHVTLGRWKQSRPSDAGRVLQAGRKDMTAGTTVADVTLFQSRTSPDGAVYTPLCKTALAGPLEQPLQ